MSFLFVWSRQEWENYLHSRLEKYKLMSENKGERESLIKKKINNNNNNNNIEEIGSLTAIYISREKWERRKARETAVVGSCSDVLELSFFISLTKTSGPRDHKRYGKANAHQIRAKSEVEQRKKHFSKFLSPLHAL